MYNTLKPIGLITNICEKDLSNRPNIIPKELIMISTLIPEKFAISKSKMCIFQLPYFLLIQCIIYATGGNVIIANQGEILLHCRYTRQYK